ncbi:hypothetical protein JOC94_001116 [Bacillus thermophilus]|uniref:Uncharacterized protein n=1 Tax=Siminovitchia thermophila TaxID=1245522 RepID=A0ABS2R4R2_9BACI|nr:hypothetical protein [Siminovitchia thermophila]
MKKLYLTAGVAFALYVAPIIGGVVPQAPPIFPPV